MGSLEAGKAKVEQHIMELARGMKRDSSLGTILWWSAGSPDSDGAVASPDATVPLRIYDKGSGWRSLRLLQSDINACVDSPDVLGKYDSEITEILSDL
jgi:hypothetical protein